MMKRAKLYKNVRRSVIATLGISCILVASSGHTQDSNSDRDEWLKNNSSGKSEAWRDSWPEVEQLKTVKVSQNIHLVHGVGGTVAVYAAAEGTLLVDSGHFRVLESRLYPAVNDIAKDKPVRYIVNTHGHGDHGAGNTHYIGLGAVAISHSSVPNEYTNAPPHYPSLPPEGLPAITFNDKMTLYFDERIEMVHVPYGHSKGDIVVYFNEQNVMHTGDIFIKSGYVSVAGMYKNPKGSTLGLIEAQKIALAFGDENTKYITGHSRGVVVGREELERDHQMLVTVVGRIKKGIEAGKTLEQIKATKPTREFDSAYVWPGMTAERTVENYYYGIVGDPPASKRRFM